MDNAERAIEVVYRYVKARALVRGILLDGNDWAGLKDEIRNSRLVAGFIYIDLEDPQVIKTDERDHKFYEAIIEGRNDAIDMDVGQLTKWRNYVLNDGLYPPYLEC